MTGLPGITRLGLPGITITSVYDGRVLMAVEFHCFACGQTWRPHPQHRFLTARSSSPFDRECAEHQRGCHA